VKKCIDLHLLPIPLQLPTQQEMPRWLGNENENEKGKGKSAKLAHGNKGSKKISHVKNGSESVRKRR